MRKYIVLFAILVLLGSTLAYSASVTAVQPVKPGSVVAPAVRPVLSGILVSDFKIPEPPAGAADACTADLKKMSTDWSSCMSTCGNLDSPPTGSPADNFNKMTNIQLGQYCGNLTMDACVAKVKTEQRAYCQKGSGLLACESGVCCAQWTALTAKAGECGKKRETAKKVCADIDTRIRGFLILSKAVESMIGTNKTLTQQQVDSLAAFMKTQSDVMAGYQQTFKANECDKY
jgi:hypothetical protein